MTDIVATKSGNGQVAKLVPTTITNRILVEAFDILVTPQNGTAPFIARADLNRSVSLRLSRAIQRLRLDYDALMSEREKILEAAAEKDEQGRMVSDGPTKVKLRDPQRFTNEWNALLAEQIEVTLPRIREDELPEQFQPTVGLALLELGILVEEGE